MLHIYDYKKLKYEKKTEEDKIKYLSYRLMIPYQQAYYMYKELRKEIIKQ